MIAPIIVTALLDDASFAWADGLRRAHFPPERNVLSAHLTLFHHLPPSLSGELDHRLTAVSAGPPLPASAASLMSLGRGVAFRIDCPGLATIREDLAEAFELVLTPQDRAGWRPHITIQNKVAPEEARKLMDDLRADFRPRPITITGLASWYYRDGPWEAIGRYTFRG
ncbi:2'-5' RNA ligase family protein [Sphingomonas sp. ID0503]|uniref:2'-5' RNA ligase family protein n=1 Tax=Sphingomonas sp. ID0503 TaxID=3399691 RepID=UPI003AFB598A